ncbi:MAG: rRNA methyltransferase, partial [Thermoactinospora sp.]|nr:rRNA methyltransferase [Thermoactinospora sp.]
MPEYVFDAADPRIADYTRLRDVDLRKSLEAERGLFLAEGEKVIRRAIAAGYPIRSILTTRRWLESLSDVIGEATVYEVSDELMSGIAGFPVHRGALASMRRLPLPPAETLIKGAARRLLVL